MLLAVERIDFYFQQISMHYKCSTFLVPLSIPMDYYCLIDIVDVPVIAVVFVP